DVCMNEKMRVGLVIGHAVVTEETPVSNRDRLGKGLPIFVGLVRLQRLLTPTFQPLAKVLRVLAPTEYHQVVIAFQMQTPAACRKCQHSVQDAFRVWTSIDIITKGH